MADPKGDAHRRLRRLTLDSPGVVTLNIRASRIIVFWSAISGLAAPIDSGWFLHAASVAGGKPGAGGESGAEFDLSGIDVRWQHAKIGQFSKVDLPLDAQRSYVFYITPKAATREQLLADEWPWPFVFRAPKSAGQPTLIGFEVFTFESGCDCGKGGKKTIKAKPRPSNSDLVGFGPTEHNATAWAPTREGKAAQNMVDAWALNGLIDGGAMIDTRDSFDRWQFWCPVDRSVGDDSSITPVSPYGRNRITGTWHWHYVLPAAQQSGAAWTESSLRAAIADGRAAAITIGQTIMLGGDLFGDATAMETNDDRWKNPESAMKVYWDARNWLASKKGNADFNGYQQKFGVIYMVFDLLTRDPASFGSGTVNELRDAPTQDGDVDERMMWLPAFRALERQARKVDAVIDLIKLASGPSRYSEIHFLAQALGKRGDLSFPNLKRMVPWMADVDVQARLTAAGFDSAEAAYIDSNGADDELVQIVSTNGNYASLALANWTHFSYGGLNFKTFSKFHSDALGLVSQHAKDNASLHPIPGRALFLTGFGCHFLTDGFSASHLRTPRKPTGPIGPFSAKLMHDADGLVGLWVYHRPGGIEANLASWRAFGDGHLRGADLDGSQLDFLKSAASGSKIVIAGNMGKVDTSPDANFEHVAATVGSAFKQLHYQAHAAAYPKPADQVCRPSTPLQLSEPPEGTRPSVYLKAILDFNGPVGSDPAKANQLKHEDLAPGLAGAGTLWPNIDLSSSERIAFIKTLLPIPYESRETGTFSEFENIAPLFSKDLKLNVSGTYTIEKGAGAWWKTFYRRHSHYRGFTLKIHWGSFESLSYNFDKYFYMIKFFSDVEGLDGYVDKSLLDVYENLPED